VRVGSLLAIVAVASSGAAARQVPERSVLLNPDSPEFTRPAPTECRIRLETTKGDIVLEVVRAWSPLGADRFVNLVRYGYYDDTRLFRVVKDRWAQFGINGDPAIAKAWRPRTFPDDPFTESNVKGTIAFAFAVPNGRTTQVFFNLRDNSATHDKEPFTPFGRIVEGMDAMDAFNSEYGDNAVGGIRAGKQDAFFNGGNAFLDPAFPRLDRIKQATLLPQAK
jgi:cyclophilin family peptidyl-prolyl cis-trans isomerase